MVQAFDDLVEAFGNWQVDINMNKAVVKDVDKAIDQRRDRATSAADSDDTSGVTAPSVSSLQAKIDELTASLKIHEDEIQLLIAQNKDLREQPTAHGPIYPQQPEQISSKPSHNLSAFSPSSSSVSSAKSALQQHYSPVQEVVAKLLQMPAFPEENINPHEFPEQIGKNGWEAYDSYNGKLDTSPPARSSNVSSRPPDRQHIRPSPTNEAHAEVKQRRDRSSSTSEQNASPQTSPSGGIKIAGLSGRKPLPARKPLPTSIKIAGRAKRAASQVSRTSSRGSRPGLDTTSRRASETSATGTIQALGSGNSDDAMTFRTQHPKGWRLPSMNHRDVSSGDESTSPPGKPHHHWAIEDKESPTNRTVFTTAKKFEAQPYHPAWKPVSKTDDWRPRPYAKDSESRAFPNGRGASTTSKEGDGGRRSTHYIGEQASQEIDYEEYRQEMDKMEAEVDVFRASWENQRKGISGRFNARNRQKADVV